MKKVNNVGKIRKCLTRFSKTQGGGFHRHIFESDKFYPFIQNHKKSGNVAIIQPDLSPTQKKLRRRRYFEVFQAIFDLDKRI